MGFSRPQKTLNEQNEYFERTNTSQLQCYKKKLENNRSNFLRVLANQKNQKKNK